MMTIILMRHGKSVLRQSGWITPAEMASWIEHYNLSEVETDDTPIASLQLANSAVCIVASTAQRALSSVQALNHTVSITDSVFCEAQLPFALWRFPRLPPSMWVVFFRLLWLFGYSRGADSIRVTKIRAKSAAHKLIALAENGTVLLVGHGIMNHLIAKELNALGWAGPKKQESHFWGASVYGLQTQYCGQEKEARHPYHQITQPTKAS